MDSYTERASSPGTERILIDFYNTDDDTTNTSITSNRRRETFEPSNRGVTAGSKSPASKRGEIQTATAKGHSLDGVGEPAGPRVGYR